VKRRAHEAAGDRFCGIIHRHAGWTVALVLCITIVFGAALPQLRFENVPGKLDLPPDDPVKIQRDYFESTFGRGETIIVGLEFDRDIDASGLHLIQKLTDDFGRVDGVSSVYSLANAVDFGWMSMLGINVLRPKLMISPKARSEDSTVKRAIGRIAGNSLYRNALVSGDERSTAIIVTADPGEVSERTGIRPLRHLVEELRTKSRLAEDEGVKVHLAGTSILNIALQDAMRRDVSIFGPLSLAAFLIIMIAIFRAWRPVLAGLLTALIALVWSLGLLPLTGTPMSLGLSMIIPLVLSLSLMYSTHHLACVFRQPKDDAGESRVTTCWKSLIVPAVFCGLTTGIGFLSLAISPLSGIREVGIFVGIDAIFAALLANFFLPAMLNLLGWHGGQSARGIGDSFVISLTNKLQRIVLPRPGRLVGIIIIMAIVAGAGVFRLKAETNHLEYLSRDRTVSESFSFVDTLLGGVLPVEILVDVPIDSAAGPVKRILQVEDSLRAMPSIGSVISAADFIQEAESAKPQKSGPLEPPLFLSRGYIPPQIWKQVSARSAGPGYVHRRDMVVTLRTSCRAHIAGSDHLQEMVAQIAGLCRRHLPNDPVIITGLAAYFARVEDYVVSTQIKSFAVALALVILLLGIHSRTPKIAAAVTGVNVLPVLIVLGIMGWVSIPLDVSTVMIASIALGMIVDDTIHLTYGYRRELSSGKPPQEALAGTLKRVGLPVITTSLILAVGFLSLVPARFVPTSYFGGLSALTIIIAGLADLVMLPALLILMARDKNTPRTSDTASR
jgi:predicted RND superfamily exporter protein